MAKNFFLTIHMSKLGKKNQKTKNTQENISPHLKVKWDAILFYLEGAVIVVNTDKIGSETTVLILGVISCELLFKLLCKYMSHSMKVYILWQTLISLMGKLFLKILKWKMYIL